MAMQLRMSPQEDKMLALLAEDLRISKNQTVAKLVRDAWEREQNKQRTHALLDDLSGRRASLLDRLAQ